MKAFNAMAARSLRARLSKVRTRPAPYQVDELIHVITDLINALEHYTSVVQVSEGSNVVIRAQESVHIVNGPASIAMDKSGDVTIRGRKLDTRTTGDVLMKGSKIRQN